jgi:ABC-type phosphate/phosphonate transport system substrate-binding protein
MNLLKTIFIFLFLLIYAGPTLAQELKIGIFPRRAAPTTMKMFKPLADALAKEAGCKTKIILSKNFSYFWKGVKGKKFDIVHFSPYHFLLLKK